MAKIDYEKVKAQIVEAQPEIKVDEEVKAMRAKLMNLTKEGAVLIIANKLGLKIEYDKPKPTIKSIDMLKDGDDFVEIAGAVISAFDLRFYEVCPNCAKRVREQSSIWKCEEHGVVSPAYSYLWNMMIDDGTDNIRVTLFSKQTERLLGMNSSQVLKFRENTIEFDQIKTNIIGKLLAFRGTVKLNSHTNKTEFNARLIFKEPKDVTPRVEAVTALTKLPADNSDEEVQEEIIE